MPQRISEEEIREQVLLLMFQLGISPASNENLQLDGELHRYDIEGDRRGKRNGAYCIHTDGIPAGFVQDWKRDVKTKWKYDTSRFSAEEREYYDSEEYKKKSDEERKRKEAERKAKQAEASERARILFESLPPAECDHKYLQRKQIYSYGLRKQEDMLAVPLRDINGIVRSIQWIKEDGTKRFYPGAKIEGLMWSVALDTLKEETTERICLCEGMGTGAKAYELTNIPVVAAISCYHLEETARMLRDKYPKAEVIILADDDKETEEKQHYNPGVREAKKAVEKGYANLYVTPPFKSSEEGTDWDDYALKYGDEKCAEELEGAIDRERIAQRRKRYEAEAKRLGLLTSSMFIEFCQPLKDSSYLIEDWIPSESLTMLFAPSGSGKGFVVCDLAYAISNPEITDWHGKKIHKHGPVVYVAGEGQRGLRKRFAGLVSYKGYSAELTEMAIITETVPIDEKNAETGINRLIANIGMKYPNPVLIILDTVNTSMNGDENKTVDATTFTNAEKRLIEEFHSTVLNVHHTGLNPEAQGRARGSSVFKAAMDMELKLTKNGELLTLEMTKSKDTDIQSPMVFNLLSIEVPEFIKATGEQETTCVLELNEQATELFSDKTKQPKGTEKTSKTEIFAKETYERAAQKFGILLEDEVRQREVVSVQLEDWREVYYEMSSADKEDTRRKQFKRARELLLETKHILFKKQIGEREYYCIEPSGDAFESALILHIRRKNEDPRYKD